MGGEEAVTWEEAVNMGVNMGGGCGVCIPPRNYSADQGGPEASSKLDGGLKAKHGSEGTMGGA